MYIYIIIKKYYNSLSHCYRLFYGGRRRYLIDVGPDDKLSRKEAILLPPDLLKTPRQRRYTSR